MANPKVGSENMTYDALLVLEDGAAAKTATGVGQDGGAAAEVEVGAGQLRNANLLVDVSDADDGDANETYVLTLEGTDDDFSTVKVLATLAVVAGTVGRNSIPFDNVQDEVIHDKVRLRHTLGGTTPSLTYTARIGVK